MEAHVSSSVTWRRRKIDGVRGAGVRGLVGVERVWVSAAGLDGDKGEGSFRDSW